MLAPSSTGKERHHGTSRRFDRRGDRRIIGALAWAGISYGTGYEIGWIAWIIGGGVGVGFALGDRGESGFMGGALAAIIAIASILGGKYLAVEWFIDKGFSEAELLEIANGAANDHEYVLSFVADEVIKEWEQAGRAIQWPGGAEPDGASRQADYPADAWAEATQRWSAMSGEERTELQNFVRTSEMELARSYVSEFRSEIAKEGFFRSFGVLDVVFFLLAIGTAFKIAEAGGITSDSE